MTRIRFLSLLAAILLLGGPGVAGAQATATGGVLPSEIPLFPLPEVVLFPGVSRPLLIYEPRYREMVADALEGDRLIGMVLLRPGFEADYEGRPPIYAIGCAGRIEEYEQLPDGRYTILLRGVSTFRVLAEDQRKPYRLARVEALARAGAEDAGALADVRDQLERELLTVLPLGVEPPDADLGDAEFVNVVSQFLGMPEATRQELLEQGSVAERGRALLEVLRRR